MADGGWAGRGAANPQSEIHNPQWLTFPQFMALDITAAPRAFPTKIEIPAADVVVVAYGITSLALSRMACGSATPRALAVFRLTTSSNWVGWLTGRSAGLAPAATLPM